MSVQHDQPVEMSPDHSDDASFVFQKTRYPVVVRGLLQQFCSGYAVMLVFARLALHGNQSPDSPHQLVNISLASAALLIGIGLGFPLQSWIARLKGQHTATRAGLGLTACGITASTLGPLPWGLVVGSILTGLGLFGEWTPSAESTRQALSSTHRWGGMRLHGVTWFCGAVLATLIVNTTASPVLVATGILIALTCVSMIPLTQRVAVTDPSDGLTTDSHVSGEPPRSLQTPQAEHSRNPQAEPAGDSETCEAEDCCGGGCEWTPMPVWLGACLAFSGLCAIGMILPWLAADAAEYSWGPAIIGGLLGTILFQAVVPTTGYAVLLVPGCLLGVIVFLTAPWLGSVWPGGWLVCQGAVSAAIYCGCSGLIGESFVDSCQGNSRTVVLLMGSMAAGAIAILTGIASTLISPMIFLLMSAALCVATIYWLRKIPSLLVSQRRQDEISSDEPEKLLTETIGAAGGPPE